MSVLLVDVCLHVYAAGCYIDELVVMYIILI